MLGVLVHPHVGSGGSCEGFGFGCTPERDLATAFVVTVYGATALAVLAIAWLRSRRGRPWRLALAGGLILTVLVTALVVRSQLPHYAASPGPLSGARAYWEEVLAEGRAVAPLGTPLGDALRSIRRTQPVTCRDAYGRSTGLRRVEWASRGIRGGHGIASGGGAGAALDSWAERLRTQGVAVEIDHAGGGPSSDRRLRIYGSDADSGGILSVRASAYISELEVTASTACHRS